MSENYKLFWAGAFLIQPISIYKRFISNQPFPMQCNLKSHCCFFTAQRNFFCWTFELLDLKLKLSALYTSPVYYNIVRYFYTPEKRWTLYPGNLWSVQFRITSMALCVNQPSCFVYSLQRSKISMHFSDSLVWATTRQTCSEIPLFPYQSLCISHEWAPSSSFIL